MYGNVAAAEINFRKKDERIKNKTRVIGNKDIELEDKGDMEEKLFQNSTNMKDAYQL